MAGPWDEFKVVAPSADAAPADQWAEFDKVDPASMIPSHGAPAPAAPTAPSPSKLERVQDYVRGFFDPQYGHPEMGAGEAFVRQGLKAGSLLTGNPALGGALASAGMTEAKDPLGVGLDIAKGAVGGKVAGIVVPRVIGGAVALARLARGGPKIDATSLLRPAEAMTAEVPAGEAAVPRLLKSVSGGKVSPGPSAQLLSSHGVRMTRAQSDPGSAVNKLEQAMENTHPHGAEIAAQRGVFRRDVQTAALNVSRPPGMAPLPMDTAFDDGLTALDAGFDHAYEAVGKIPVYPAVQGAGGGPLQGMAGKPGVIESAVDSIRRLPPSRRQLIKDDIADLLGTLPERNGAVGRVAADDLLSVRSVLRARARQAAAEGGVEGSAAEEAYRSAAQKVTDAIEPQLPAGVADHLRNTDAAYRNFVMVDNAARAARTRVDGFTGIDLAREASKGMRGVDIQQGKAGPLYDIGMAAADVGRTVAPRTGASGVTLQTAVEGLDLLPYVGPKVKHWVNARSLIGANRAAMSPAPLVRPDLRLPGLGATGLGANQIGPEDVLEFVRRYGQPRLPAALGEEEPTPR